MGKDQRKSVSASRGQPEPADHTPPLCCCRRASQQRRSACRPQCRRRRRRRSLRPHRALSRSGASAAPCCPRRLLRTPQPSWCAHPDLGAGTFAYCQRLGMQAAAAGACHALCMLVHMHAAASESSVDRCKSIRHLCSQEVALGRADAGLRARGLAAVYDPVLDERAGGEAAVRRDPALRLAASPAAVLDDADLRFDGKH